MSMLQLDFRLPEFGNLVKDLGLEEGGRAQQHLVKNVARITGRRSAMSNVSVEYLVLRDNVEYSRLTAFKGGGAAISVTADAAVKWALSGKFAQNRAVNYLTDVIQPVLTIDGVRQPLGKYIPTDAYTEHDGMRPVVSLTAYDLTYLAMSSKIETRLHLAKGTLYTAAIQALLVESGITDFFVEANTATLQADREDWEPGTDRLTIINALAAEINYNSIWMDGGGTVHCSAFRMPSADAISVTYRDGEYSIQYPEWTQAVDLFDHPNVFIAEVDNPDLETSMRAVSVNDRPDSVFSTVNLGRRVVSYEKLDNIASQAELQAYADNKRFKSLQSTETRTFYTGPSGRHAVFDLVELVRDGESTLYEETGWRLELEQPYKMTHTGKRVVYL